MSVSTDLDEYRRVAKEMSKILEEFANGRRSVFTPASHLSPEAYHLFKYHTKD